MGRQTYEQSHLLYLFDPESPTGHLLCWINPIVTR
jgi:hypothetical protein